MQNVIADNIQPLYFTFVENITTLLIQASGKGNVDEVKKLLYDGANANEVDIFDFSALHFANNGFMCNPKITKLLISYGANVNLRHFGNATPLHMAAWYGLEENCRVLIIHGADCNASVEQGWTPLHWASQFGHDNVCRLLLRHKANCNAKNEKGETISAAKIFLKSFFT